MDAHRFERLGRARYVQTRTAGQLTEQNRSPEGSLSLILSPLLRRADTNSGVQLEDFLMFLFSNDQRTPRDDKSREKSAPKRKATFWLIVLKGVLAILKFIVWLIDQS